MSSKEYVKMSVILPIDDYCRLSEIAGIQNTSKVEALRKGLGFTIYVLRRIQDGWLFTYSKGSQTEKLEIPTLEATQDETVEIAADFSWPAVDVVTEIGILRELQETDAIRLFMLLAQRFLHKNLRNWTLTAEKGDERMELSNLGCG